MKILVAVDFSPVGREVAHAGYRLAKKIGKEITFFHCAPQTERFLQGYDIKAFIPLSQLYFPILSSSNAYIQISP